jgi:hypothetical protein
MTSAKLFSQSVGKCGTGCKMLKFDFQDAYKNVPLPLADINLQGFRWLGAYFVELQVKQMFWAAASVQNFDILGNIVKSCNIVTSKIPRKLVHRQLDDVPVVAQKNLDWGNEFEVAYRSLCDHINARLAPDCPAFEKSIFKLNFWKSSRTLFRNKNTFVGVFPKRKLINVCAINVCFCAVGHCGEFGYALRATAWNKTHSKNL